MIGKDEAIQEVVKILFFDGYKRGLGKGLTRDEITQLLPQNLSNGFLDVLFASLEDEWMDDTINTKNDETGDGYRRYYMGYESFEHFYDEFLEPQVNPFDDWESVTFENYDMVSKSADQLAEAVRGDNETNYFTEHREEAIFICSKLESFAKDIKSEKGKTPRKRLKEIMQSLDRLIEFFSGVARIYEFINNLKNYIGI